MKSIAILGAAALLLSGCATTLRSDVTAFNDWPADVGDKSYSFQSPPPAEDTLEFRSYETLVGNELAKLGFHRASDAGQAKLLVGMHFSTVDRPTKILTATDPFGPYWGPGYGRYGFYRWGYRPFYDPFYYGPATLEEQIQHNYERQLHVTINTSTGHKLYDVTVQNTSRVKATPHVMPALVQSAFADFPGQSGVPHKIDIKIEPKDESIEVVPPAKMATAPAAKAD